ncbi:ankyrin repeat and sterile alpha motif domain-containing protein 1B [Trichonephila clavipes]|uniref:Ankyrin repeat and sterile alpha motif domain-containing protein 1B n=1 Tax=Trichonephila clavipes TaxID=2585209 RepID=A0A8X6SIU4_TRICX|nr:ankyrin repeat and sterile alpha motif domain-containing protein 1B [Trichonephila clavipes]
MREDYVFQVFADCFKKLNPGWARSTQPFIPFSGSINEYQVCLGTKHWGFSCQADHLTVISAHAPHCPRSCILRWAHQKKISRDIETLTDEQLVATLGPHGEVELTLATDNKCVSTEVENTQNNPFAGLHHGSVSTSYFSENSFLNQLRKTDKHISSCKSRNIYENVQIAMEEDRNKVILSVSDCGIQSNNCSCLSVMSPFDEKAEWAEIAGIMASFGGTITRESFFAQDVEYPFTQAFKTDDDSGTSENFYCINSLEQWLSQIGLPQYENLLVLNGFDDLNFMLVSLFSAAPYGRISVAASNFDAQFPLQREVPELRRCKLVLVCRKHPSQTDTLRIFYMLCNHATWLLSIFYIVKIRQLGPGLNPQP